MNLAQIATCAVALTALSASCAQAAPALATNNVNMRQGPGTNYPVITTIPGGSTVEVSGCQGEWCSVSWHGPERLCDRRALGPGRRRAATVRRTGPATGLRRPHAAPEVRRPALPQEDPIRRRRATRRQATRRHPAIVTLRVTPRIIIRVPIITARITGRIGTAAGGSVRGVAE